MRVVQLVDRTRLPQCRRVCELVCWWTEPGFSNTGGYAIWSAGGQNQASPAQEGMRVGLLVDRTSLLQCRRVCELVCWWTEPGFSSAGGYVSWSAGGQNRPSPVQEGM